MDWRGHNVHIASQPPAWAHPIARWLRQSQWHPIWHLCRPLTSEWLPEPYGTGPATFGLESRTQPLQTGQICDLLQLHANADDGLAGLCRRHNCPDTSVNDRKIRHLIDLQRRNPIGDENIGGNMRIPNLGKLKLHRSDQAVRLPLKALDDFSDDLARARASHCKVDERLVPRYFPDFLGYGKLVLWNEGTREEMVGRQFDPLRIRAARRPELYRRANIRKSSCSL